MRSITKGSLPLLVLFIIDTLALKLLIRCHHLVKARRTMIDRTQVDSNLVRITFSCKLPGAIQHHRSG